MKSVAYCRVSTDKQKDEGTIQIQVDEIRNYCNKNNIQLVGIFQDEGISGSNEIENRIGLPALLSFIEENEEIESVVIYKLDRLARDLYLQEHIIKQLEKMDVSLISTKERDLESNDPIRKGFRQFIGLIAEMEKSFITMRLSAGRNKKARQGGYAGGRVPLGYKLKEEDSTLMISDENRETISLIFRLKRKRKSLGEIARHLNENNFPTARGGKWYPSTVKYILENKIYKGKYSYNEIQVDNQTLRIINN